MEKFLPNDDIQFTSEIAVALIWHDRNLSSPEPLRSVPMLKDIKKFIDL